MTWDWFLARFAFAMRLGVLAAALFACVPRADASNLLNFYAGAAYVRAHMLARDPQTLPAFGAGQAGAFDRSDTGYQFTLGARGLDFFGAEIDVFDLGSGSVLPVSTSVGSVSGADLSQKGEAAFALFYLPIPEPFVDVYLKAGVDRMTSTLGGTFLPSTPCPTGVSGPVCGPTSFALSRTTTGFAAGAGVQWNVGNWGVRAEYERLTALGEHPTLVSFGVIWTFL